MAKKRLGRMLAQARQVKGKKLRDMEKEVGISNAYISQLEGDQIKEPSPHKLHALADYLGLDYADLMEAAGYVTQRDPSAANEPGIHFMGERLTDDEAAAMAAFLRTLRDVKKLTP